MKVGFLIEERLVFIQGLVGVFDLFLHYSSLFCSPMLIGLAFE